MTRFNENDNNKPFNFIDFDKSPSISFFNCHITRRSSMYRLILARKVEGGFNINDSIPPITAIIIKPWNELVHNAINSVSLKNVTTTTNATNTITNIIIIIIIMMMMISSSNNDNDRSITNQRTSSSIPFVEIFLTTLSAINVI